MEFEPLTIEEKNNYDMMMAAFEGTLKPGKAQFKVIKADEGFSKSGNPMITVVAYLYDEHGGNGKLKDWLLANNDFGRWKIDRFLRAIGKAHLEAKKKVEVSDILNAEGECVLNFSKNKQGDLQLGIAEYCIPNEPVRAKVEIPVMNEPLKAMAAQQAKAKAIEAQVKANSEEFNDDIPF